MSAPKKFKSALKKLCDRAKSALNSQARISSPENRRIGGISPKMAIYYRLLVTTGAPKLINSDLFLEKRATVPIKTQGVQRSSSGKMSTF